MKNIILIILMLLVSITVNSQIKVVKTASVSSISPGETFYYQITISGLSNLSQIQNIEDNLGTDLTYISDDLSTSPIYAMLSGFCSGGITNLTNTAGYNNTFRYNFNNCSGNVLGSGSFTFKIYVKVNPSACGKTKISNSIVLNKGLSTQISSQPSLNDPVGPTLTNITNTAWVLNKTFRRIDANGDMIFDVRLSAPNSTFGLPAFNNGVFSDTFKLPACVTVDNSSSKVYYIPNENNLSSMSLVSSSGVVDIDNLYMSWNLPSQAKSSYLFQVVITPTNCNCNGPISFKNKALFQGTDLCDNPINLIDESILNVCNCINGKIQCEENAISSDVSKKAYLSGNASNLTMTGCTGKYVIKIKNNNTSLNYTNIIMTDILPTGVIQNGAVTYSVSGGSGCNMTGTITGTNFTSTSGMLSPGCTLLITIPFIVNTSLPNFLINNCASVKIASSNGLINTYTSCASISTVPNEVTVTTAKRICSPQSHTCLGITNNNNLPGDSVIYELTFYNYGTVSASNISLQDILPNYFSIVNPATDIKIYKKLNGSADFTSCGTIGMTNITLGSSINYNSTTRNLSINLSNANKMNAFTCNGVTQYKVVVKAIINKLVPNGNYDNSFILKYKKDNNGQTDFSYSNVARTLVNNTQMIISDKTGEIVSADCIGKTNTVKYKLVFVNMSSIPITININDPIPTPSGVIAMGNVYGFKYYLGSSMTGTPVAGPPPIGTLTLLSHGFKLNLATIQPCQKFIIEYYVKYNTANLTSSQYKPACNTAIVETGFMTRGNINTFSELNDEVSRSPIRNVILSSNTDLILKWLDTNTTNRADLLEQFNKESKRVDLKRYFTETTITLPAIAPIFVPIRIDSVKMASCPQLHDCLNGSGSGCSGSPTSSFTFSVNGTNNAGVANANLNFSPNSKVRKIEFLLSDVRKLPTPCFFCCPNNITFSNPNINGGYANGEFKPSSSSPYAGFNYTFSSLGTSGINFAETNKIVYSSASPITLSGNYPINIQLPIFNLNCNGNYEFVIVAIVYFDDCSICYRSVPFDYTAVKSWIFYPHLFDTIKVDER